MAGIQRNFVVKHGLEVNHDLIFANTDFNSVGIGTTVTEKYTLKVNGGIGVTDATITRNSIISGIATVGQLVTPVLTLTGTVSAGNTIGLPGQYLVRSGAGVSWKDLPAFRQINTQTATPGQTSFSHSYTVGLLDVYINGVKLSTFEFTATDGSSITLNQPCFGNETVEFITYTFTSGIGVTDPVQITVSGNVLTFNVVGVGSTSLTLY